MGYYSDETYYPEQSIGYLVRRVQQLSMALMEERFEQEGISATQWFAMVLIHLRSNSTCATVAREIGHDKGAMTRLVDDLETKGLVIRARDRDDRRLLNLSLTDKGIEVGIRCKQWVMEYWNDWLSDLDQETVDAMIGSLTKIKTKLESLGNEEAAA